MIILFGGNGYIGSEFKRQLDKKQIPFFNWDISRKTTFSQLQTFVKYNKISHVINAAGYTGKPNVDACEINKDETFQGNVLWPQILTNWCEVNDIVLGIYLKLGFKTEKSDNFDCSYKMIKKLY